MKDKEAILLLIGLVLADQLTKLLFTDMDYGIIHYQKNYGAAFSLLEGYRWLFIAVAIIVVAGLAFYYRHAENKLPVMMIMAGSIGNMIDRLLLGYVRDFINIKIWPVFNIADSLNLIGAIWLAILLIKKEA